MQDLTGYKKEKLTINLVWANIFGLLILIPIVLIFGLPYYFIWEPGLDIRSFMDTLAITDALTGGFAALSVIIAGIVVHELIHGLVWACYARKGFRSIRFGILKEMLTPYCHCKEPLQVKHYIRGAIAPALVLGILPSLAGIYTGSIVTLLFGMFFTMAAAGDILVINLVRKESPDDLLQDHPSEAGCYIYRKTE